MRPRANFQTWCLWFSRIMEETCIQKSSSMSSRVCTSNSIADHCPILKFWRYQGEHPLNLHYWRRIISSDVRRRESPPNAWDLVSAIERRSNIGQMYCWSKSHCNVDTTQLTTRPGLTLNWVESMWFLTPLSSLPWTTQTILQSSWVCPKPIDMRVVLNWVVYSKGADVMDPPASVFDRPSYSALVSSVDSNCSNYIASIRVQPTRQQIIVDMYEMAKVFSP